jgi:hypothetical protein
MVPRDFPPNVYHECRFVLSAYWRRRFTRLFSDRTDMYGFAGRQMDGI